MTSFHIFGRSDCAVCAKAEALLTHLGVRFDKASIAREDYDMADPAQHDRLLTALSDASWFDLDPDHLPLVVAVDEQDKALKTWTGRDVADPDNSWLVAVRAWLTGQIIVIETEPPEPPLGIA